MAASGDAVDDGSLDTSVVGADIAAPVGGGEVIMFEDTDEEDGSEEVAEDWLEDEGVVDVVVGIVVDFSAGVGVFVGVGVSVFVNDVGDANKWSVLGVFAQAIYEYV